MIPEMNIEIPTSVEEALHILSNTSNQCKIIAGGTDIIPGLHINSHRFAGFDTLVDVNRIKELKVLEEYDRYYAIGSSVTFTKMQESALVRDKLPILWQAACGVGNKQIRNRATIAGNFVNNAPCADSVPALLVYDAKLVIKSSRAESLVPIEDFLKGSYKTSLLPDEIVTEIRIPRKNTQLNGTFYKLGRRRAVAISRISLAVLYSIEKNVFSDFKIASGAVTPIGTRFKEIERYVLGKKIERELLKDIAIKVGIKVLEVTGLRWSTPHKLPVLQRALYQILIQKCLEEND